MQHHEPECQAKKKNCSFAAKLGLIIQHHKLECTGLLWKNQITVFKVKVTLKVQNVSECLSRWYLLNRRTFCYQTGYGEGDTASWARVSYGPKICLLSSSLRSQRGLIWSKYESCYYICWTVDSSATKHGLMIHHIKPECLMKKKRIIASLVKVVAQGQNVNVCSDNIFKTSKHLVTKHGIVMHHHELECHAERLVCYLVCYCQGQGHSKGSYDHTMTVSTISSELLLPNLVW